MTRSRITWLLTAFPKLITKDKKPEMRLTVSIILTVCLTLLDCSYCVLITTKTSNILESLETLQDCKSDQRVNESSIAGSDECSNWMWEWTCPEANSSKPSLGVVQENRSNRFSSSFGHQGSLSMKVQFCKKNGKEVRLKVVPEKGKRWRSQSRLESFACFSWRRQSCEFSRGSEVFVLLIFRFVLPYKKDINPD